MAPTVASSGSQTATISTEHTLYTTTTAGIYVLRVDTANLAAGEQLLLQAYKKVRTGDTVRLVWISQVLLGVTAEPIWASLVVVGPFGCQFTLTQLSGTGRAFPWSVETLGTPTVASSGSQTATLNTDHSLYSTTVAGVYVLSVDANALANGERLLLTIGQKVRTGDTVRTYLKRLYRHAQPAPILQSEPVVCAFGADFTLRQEGGTGRAFPWSVDLIG